jgi:hypothetical protein
MNKNKLTVEQYRNLMKDTESTDERIQERLNYLDAFCRNIIRSELEKYKSESLQQKGVNNASKAELKNDL